PVVLPAKDIRAVSSLCGSSNAAGHCCLGGALTGVGIGILRGQGVELVAERLLRRQLSAEFKARVAIDKASGRCGPAAAKARRDAHGAAAARFLAGCWKFMWGA